MSKLQHTPGPWKFDENNFDKTITANNKIYHGVIVFDEGCFECEEGIANARLIAAAPEMLEVLIEFCKINCTECHIVCGTHCALYDSKTVIERATGLKIEEVLTCTE